VAVYFENLLGGYVDGDYFVPVRFGLKHSTTGEATLYVIVDQQPVESKKIKAEVVKTPDEQGVRAAISRSAFKISIANLARFVNGKDLLRYLPDNMLSAEQKKTKWEGVAETIKKTNAKNDEKYAKFIADGNLNAVQRMVDQAAKAAGYTVKGYHGTHSYGFTSVDGNLWLARDKSVAKTYGPYFGARGRKNGAPYDQDGVYAIYYKPGKNLYIDAEGNDWGSLPVTEEEYPGVYVIEEDGYTEITTNAMAEWANGNGYDSITFANVDDGGFTTVDVVFNPKRDAKSADPVTYDDSGKVIPLSERFKTENDDIRYSDRDFLADDQLKGNYTVSEISEMFDAWNSDAGTAELAKKVFAKLQEIMDRQEKAYWAIPYPISFKSNAYLQKAYLCRDAGVGYHLRRTIS